MNDTLVPVMVWSETNLDPLASHTFGVQHHGIDTGETYIYFDYIVVTMTHLDPSDIHKKKVTGKTIAGAVVGGILGLTAILLAFCMIRRKRSKKSGDSSRYEWEGAPATLKFVDPSSEMEASERLAREGLKEEQREKLPQIQSV